MVGRSTLQLFDPEAGPPELIHGDEVIEPVDAAVEAPVEIMAMQRCTFPWCGVTVMAGSHPEVERARQTSTRRNMWLRLEPSNFDSAA